MTSSEYCAALLSPATAMGTTGCKPMLVAWTYPSAFKAVTVDIMHRVRAMARRVATASTTCLRETDKLGNAQNRSFEKITQDDLTRLATLALADFESLFKRYQQWRHYADRLMFICLCQGAAHHYVQPSDGTPRAHEGGVNDFDVWGFFRDRPNARPFPPRRHGFQDFGPSKFGRNPDDDPRYSGRRVDVLGRSIKVRRDETPKEALRRYLREGRTESARRLAERPVVVIWPGQQRGSLVWERT